MKLSENYRLVFDANNVTLQFFEQREKVKKDGTKEMHEFTDDSYYPNIKVALKQFVLKSLKDSDSVKDCIKKIELLESKIDKLNFSKLN